jgi:spore germination protein YaaH
MLVFVIFFSLASASTAGAVSVTDLLSQTTAVSESEKPVSQSTNGDWLDIVLGLFFGKYLGNIFTGSGDKNTAQGPGGLALSTKKELIGFYAEWWGADPASFTSLSQNINSLQSIAPFWATLNEEGNLTDRGGNDHKSVVDYAHKNNKQVLLLVNNAKETNNGILPVHTLLRSQDLRRKAINNLEAYIKKYNLDGVNIDFEIVPAEDRVYLTAFMRELSERLKPQGYIVSIDVFPKQNEANDVAVAYDYGELAKYADKIIIMTYDNHGIWSGPGPIADINWVENNLKYALQFMPKNKLYLGLAAYGYDWSDKKTDSVEHTQITSLQQQYKTSILWDDNSKSPHFNYTGSDGLYHQVWFENSQSLKYKLDLVNKYDIAGAALWRLGGEDPAYWPVIRDKLQ